MINAWSTGSHSCRYVNTGVIFFFFSFLLDVDFMTLNILNLDDSYLIFFIFPKFFINLRASLQIFVENHQFHVVLSCFKQGLRQLCV